MKNLLLAIALLAGSTTTFAQNLASQFNTIAENNDMMGGSLVVFCENGILENLSVGKSDRARNIDATPDTKYRVASISKTITAIAVMQLVEQNLLDLDADIGPVLGYPVRNPHHPGVPITTRMLLSHTSSIVDGSTYAGFLTATVNNDPIPNLSEILTPGGSYYTAGQFNNTIPGSYFNYANVNYVILGTLVEKVSHARFDVYCKQNIFHPLAIDASFNVNDLTDIDQLAVLYRKVNGVWIAQVDDYQGVQPVFANLNGYTPGTNGGRFGPQGGFRVSGPDLAKIFLVLMYNGSFEGATLLSGASCSAMLANEWLYNGTNGNNYYGLFRSWGLGIHRITSTPGNDVALPGSTSMFGHAGEAYGLVSDAYFDTLRKVGFVFITNGVGIGYQTNNASVFYTVEQAVFEAVENYGNIAGCLQSVAANEVMETSNRVYPDPAADFLYVPETVRQETGEIRILSREGKLVKSAFLHPGESKIDIQALEAGFYMLVLDNRVFKFIKL